MLLLLKSVCLWLVWVRNKKENAHYWSYYDYLMFRRIADLTSIFSRSVSRSCIHGQIWWSLEIMYFLNREMYTVFSDFSLEHPKSGSLVIHCWMLHITIFQITGVHNFPSIRINGLWKCISKIFINFPLNDK